jgi:hypothetical protein
VIDNLASGHEHNLEEVRSQVDFQRADIRNYDEIRAHRARRRGGVSPGGDPFGAAVDRRSDSLA